MRIIFALLWPVAVLITNVGALLMKFSMQAGAGAGIALGMLIAGGGALFGLVVFVASAAVVARSSLLSMYALGCVIVGAACVMLTKGEISTPTRDAETIRVSRQPHEITEHEWLGWKLNPTFRDGVLVELRPLSDERQDDPIWPVWLMPRMTELEVLEYGRRRESDLMQFLPAMQRLRKLTLRRMRFDPNEIRDAFMTLSEMPDLMMLTIQQSTGIHYESIEHLAKSQSLVELELSYTRPAFQLGHLAKGAARLEILRLNGSRIDDDHFLQLADLPALKLIDISDTRVTPAGVAAFREKRPDVTVETETPKPGP